jgi:hypothetical protein
MGKSWAVETLPSATNRLTWEYCAPSGTRTPNPVDESHGNAGAGWCSFVLVSGRVRECRSSAVAVRDRPWCDVSGPLSGPWFGRRPTVRGNIGAAQAVLDAETVARAAGLEATLGELQQGPHAGVRQRARRPERPPGATP